MNNKALAISLSAAIFFLPALAHAEDNDVQISASLTGATDYVWRGVSQSDEDPAVFAAINVGIDGFYVGAGTENVDFAGVNQEYDLRAGYAFSLGKNVKLDLGVVRYGYIDAPVDIDTLEVKAGLSGSVGKIGLGVTGYHTWDYFGTNESANYVEASASFPLIDKLSGSAAVGHQQISNLPDYNTWNAGISYEVLTGAKVDLRYHDTDTSTFGTLADARIVGSFSVSF